MDQSEATLIDTMNNYQIQISEDQKYVEKEILEIFNKNHINIWKWDNIEIKEKLGSGGFSNVSKGVYKNKEYAFKEMILHKSEWDQLLNELLIMKRFNNENFVQMRAITYKILDNGTLKIRLILELLDYDLHEYIYFKERKSEEVIQFSIQILEALDEMHEQGLIHRDIKPKNILIKEDQNANKIAKLADFGIAVSESMDIINDDLCQKFTKSYASSEVVKNEKLTIKSDIWSFGIVLFELCTGVKPYYQQYSQYIDVLSYIEQDKSPFYEDWQITVGNKVLVSIIEDCVNIGGNYQERPCAYDIIKKLGQLDPKTIIFQCHYLQQQNEDVQIDDLENQESQLSFNEQNEILSQYQDSDQDDNENDSEEEENSFNDDQKQQNQMDDLSKQCISKIRKLKIIKRTSSSKIKSKEQSQQKQDDFQHKFCQQRVKVYFDKNSMNQQMRNFKSILQGSQNNDFEGDWTYITPYFEKNKLNFLTFKIIHIVKELKFGIFKKNNKGKYDNLLTFNKDGSYVLENKQQKQCNFQLNNDDKIVLGFNPYQYEISVLKLPKKQYLNVKIGNLENCEIVAGVFLQDSKTNIKLISSKIQELNDQQIQILMKYQDKKQEMGKFSKMRATYKKDLIMMSRQTLVKQLEQQQQRLPKNSQFFNFNNKLFGIKQSIIKGNIVNYQQTNIPGKLVQGTWFQTEQILDLDNVNSINFKINKLQSENGISIGIINLQYADQKGIYGYGCFNNKHKGQIFLNSGGKLFNNSTKFKNLKNFHFQENDIISINFSPQQKKIYFINFTQDLTYAVSKLQILEGNYIFAAYLKNQNDEICII